ncbi:FAR1-related sequence 5-like protein [Tanacetum coccineum]
MMTSSTSSLLPANSPTTNLPPATTTNLPLATSTTTNLPPATSTTSHLLLETYTTSHLPPVTSSTSHLLSSSSTARVCNINEADLFVVLVVGEENLLIEAEIEELDDVVTMNEECRKPMEGVPKEININTLDPQNNDKQVRNTRYRITGCMARIKVDLDHVSGKYEITKFVAKHNHQLLPKEYKHLTKKQRKMPQAEKMFVVRASTMRLGATKAHNLYSKMKGGTQYVHGTSDDFKNHIRDVNAFIGESDAQMLINKMENRKKFVPNFTFHYLVENSELVAMFWADEVAKCNYKEFGDIISFDATFRTNKYDMVFVPFTGIDNHLKCVNFGSGMLLREDTEAYTWLLTSFMTAHEKQPTMVVTDQDGAMKRAIEAVLTESTHRLCMWHIMQKVPAKVFEISSFNIISVMNHI